MNLQPLDLSTARRLLDFSGGDPALCQLGELQLEGAVALHNMIADPDIGVGYLADEVGMGKTYIALGVVALLRYFNPALRVLFICPKKNVQDKWFNREYRSFTERNVKVNQYRIRTLDGKPAAPRVSCRNVDELIQTASSGYFADFFIGMGAFSMSLSEDPDVWQRRLNQLKYLLPAHEWNEIVNSKQVVKDQFARALNYVLPTFDLVVIDEAHNFKHDFESSDRNRVLSSVLGFREATGFEQRVRGALLLSATPYDRNIDQLRNQLKLVGKGSLLPDDIEDDDLEIIRAQLRRFMVRRLNELRIAGKPHTRNMYRCEWRKGERAEIVLESDEQKLITALVQKKIGEMLHLKAGSPSFQMGLLASFESYAESTRSPPVEFDGEVSDREESDAEDRHVVGALVDSYQLAKLGTTLPHPKMDVVSKRLFEEMVWRGRKQIVFVRRVKSVKELKDKLDDHYNEWLFKYIQRELSGHNSAWAVMEEIIRAYRRSSRRKDEDISGGEFQESAGEAEDKQPPKNDTLFAWFFRGEVEESVPPLLGLGQEAFTTPDLLRRGLSAKNQLTSLMLELNWVDFLARRGHWTLREVLAEHAGEIAELATTCTTSEIANDFQDAFLAAQLGFLTWATGQRALPGLEYLIAHLKPNSGRSETFEISSDRLVDLLTFETFFTGFDRAGFLVDLLPSQEQAYREVLYSGQSNVRLLQTLDIHRYLIALALRTGHGIIDLYLARMRQGAENLTTQSRAAWIEDFTQRLASQSKSPEFSTWRELRDLSDQFDLIVKTNLPEIFDKTSEEYRKHLSQRLNPVAPVIGASGKVSKSRSAQARKFRMPGYPLALISTDVFQEGEDLHTFCDSVTHYGLSASPVGIEQKNGRVDRVSSFAQRRLLSVPADSAVRDDQLIQVSFPYVQESIEVLQVRQLCRNLNDFILSLHEIGGDTAGQTDLIDTHMALLNKEPVPEQIRKPLRSPFVPDVPRCGSEARIQSINEEEMRIADVTQRIENLIAKQFGRSALNEEGLIYRSPSGKAVEFENIWLTSARASGEILLCARLKDEVLDVRGLDACELIDYVQKKSWRSLYRTYAVESESQVFQLYRNSEMLVGDEQVTRGAEIEKFLDRFVTDHDAACYHKPVDDIVVGYWSQADGQRGVRYGQLQAKVRAFDDSDFIGLDFQFGVGHFVRGHRVRVYQTDQRCIFLAQAASQSTVDRLGPLQVLRYTLQRNSHIDLVEFTVNDQREIVGRVVHPLEGLTFREFMYCASTVAVFADRLEYLLGREDVF